MDPSSTERTTISTAVPARFPRLRRNRLAALAALLLLGALAVPAQGTSRTIRGQVLDENDKAVATTIVHLKNLGNKEQLSVVTDKEGRYQFNDVDMKADHELYAEWREQRSRTRTISQFDTRTRITVNLKLEPAKKSESAASKEEKPKEKD